MKVVLAFLCYQVLFFTFTLSPKFLLALILSILFIPIQDIVLKIDSILMSTSATRTLMFTAKTVEFECDNSSGLVSPLLNN